MQLVGAILDRKGHQFWSITPKDTMLDAIRTMAEHGIGALLVMEGDRLVGIVSERDYARKVILQGRKSAETPVEAVMSRNVTTATPEMTAQHGLELMTARYFRHLPVVENDRVIGVVSIGDLVKAVIEDQQFMIEELKRYVTS